MSIQGPSETRGTISKKGSSPLHFLRVMRYSKPYLRFLYPALACVVFVAFTYSLNLVALLPMIKVIVEEQGIPAWTHQYIAEQRLDVRFKDKGSKLSILEIDSDSPLADGLPDWDTLTLARIDDSPLPSDQLLRRLASDDFDGSVRLGFDFIHDGQRVQTDVSVIPRPVPRLHQFARWMVSWLPETDTPDAKMNTLIMLLVAVLIVGFTGAVCRFFGEYLISLVAGRTVVNLRRHMYDRVLQLPVSHFAQHGVSDLVSRFVQDSQDVYRGLNFVFAKSLREPLKALFTFGTALVLDWHLTLLAVVAAPLGALLIRRFGRRIRKANRRLLHNYGRMLAALEGALGGIRVVKGYGMERYERRHLFGVDQAMLKQQLKISRVEAMSSPVFEMIGRVAATFAILYFARLMLHDEMEFSKFAVLGACMAGMFDPIR
ncbi:MAG: ABC transporter transmembrane domain-containing protein, partial [Phycisphaerae bacterium]